MRKNLFLSGVMLAVTLTVSAQTSQEVKPLTSDKLKKINVSTAIQSSNFLTNFDRKKVYSAKDVKIKGLAKAPNKIAVAADSYLAYFYGGGDFSYTDSYTIPTITFSGNTATITNIGGFEGENSITGTVSDGKITIAPQTLLKDALVTGGGVKYDLCIGYFDGSAAPTDIVLSKNEYGIYATDGKNYIALYAGTPSIVSGLFDTYKYLEVTPTTSLIPYYSTDDLWYYGYNIDREESPTPYAVASKNGSTINFTSYVTNFDNYTPVWGYINSEETAGEGNPFSMPVTSTAMNFPVCYAFYKNDQVKTPFCYDQNTIINGDGSSILEIGNESIDYGFTTAYSFTFPASSTEEFIYGTQEFSVSQTEKKKAGSILVYYPNKGNDFSFKSLDVLLGYAQGETANLTAAIITVTGMNDGFPILDESAKIVAVAQKSISSIQSWGTFASTTNGFSKNYDWGLLNFSDFKSTDGTALSSIELDKPFVVQIAGFDKTIAGIAPEANVNFSKFLAEENENVFIEATDNYIYRMGNYRNAALYFRNATVGTGVNSIDNLASDNAIKAYTNGTAFITSYPEGMTSVEVLNVAGQKIANYNLEGTSATISTAGLANGLYLLKFNDGSTVKVMK